MDTKTWLLIIFGVIFISVLLFISIKKGGFAPQQFFVIRVVLAISAAAISAILPGYISLPSSAQIPISAGGAMALFAVIYFLNPPNLMENAGLTRKEEK